MKVLRIIDAYFENLLKYQTAFNSMYHHQNLSLNNVEIKYQGI